MRDWLLQLVIYALVAWVIWLYARGFIRARRDPLRVEEVWHSSAAEFADGGRYLAVEKHLGQRFRLSVRCDGAGQLSLLLLVADASSDQPQFVDAMLRFVTDTGRRHEGAAKLVRADKSNMALDYEDRAGLPALLSVLSEASTYFEVVASCALWDGDRTIGVGAYGLAPQLSALMAIADRQRLYMAELTKLDDPGTLRH